MSRKNGAVFALLAGATLFAGGCLNWRQILVDVAIYAGTEFLLDNSNLLDLFPDGPVNGG